MIPWRSISRGRKIAPLLHTAAAFVLGTLIGFERQWHAGLRTNVLDAVVAALERSPLVRSATWTAGTTA